MRRAIAKSKIHLFLVISFWLLFALIAQPIAFAAEGKLIFDKVHSPAIEGNLLGDSAERSVIVYLPPSYETSLQKRYPVVYLFHGGLWFTNTLWVDGGGLFPGFNIQTVMDKLVQANKSREMIIVMPTVLTNKYMNACYTNSPVLGNYEDYLTRDLVKYVDGRYRTLPQAASRGVAGHSLGGYGAFYLALTHPDIYGAVYGHDPSFLNFGTSFELTGDSSNTVEAITVTKSKDMKQLAAANPNVIQQLGIAASFSPNPENPPFFVDWPYELIDGKPNRIESIWKKWLSFEPVTIVARRKTEIHRLTIRFDAASGSIRFHEGREYGILPSSRIFDKMLTDSGIPHMFEEFEGTHTNHTVERMETKVLPFFSDVLAFEMLPTVSVQPHGKLTTTWGEIKRSR